MSTAGYSRMVHDAFSERQQQQGGGGWEALDPPGQNDGGDASPPIPPAVDAPGNGKRSRIFGQNLRTYADVDSIFRDPIVSASWEVVQDSGAI